MLAIVGGLVGFAVVLGWALVRWRATGRDPTYLDDPSILLPAPPEGMTASTATIVDGGPAGDAFMAALFDLASRDEIAFRDETPEAHGAHRVGIEIRGGETPDPRIQLNRRRPVGEGEAWLLANLKSFAAMRDGPNGEAPALATYAAMSSFSGFLANALAAGADGSMAPGSGDPLAPSGAPDFQSALISALERSGRPVPDSLRSSMAHRAPMMQLLHEALSDPAAVEADPDAFARKIEQATGHKPTPEEMADGLTWLRGHEAPAGQAPAGQARPSPSSPSTSSPGTAGGGSPTYIGASRALTFHAPIGFATFVENYARRKGWIKGLSFIARLKWEGLAVIEVVAGLVVAALDGTGQGLVYGAGLGIAAGGLGTWVVARYMASRTHEGAVMKAQLAAYRRTLRATFDTTPTLDAVVSSAKLTWLETPDQALVWGVALGLRKEIEAVLQRTTSGMASGSVERSAFLPRWIGQASHVASEVAGQMATSAGLGPSATPPGPGTSAAGAGSAGAQGAGAADTEPATAVPHDYAAVFAGIERIGSVQPATRQTR